MFRLSGRNILRPYFIAEIQCFAPKLVTLQYIALYLATENQLLMYLVREMEINHIPK